MPTPSRSEPPATDPHGALHALRPPVAPRRRSTAAVVVPTLGAVAAVVVALVVGLPGAPWADAPGRADDRTGADDRAGAEDRAGADDRAATTDGGRSRDDQATSDGGTTAAGAGDPAAAPLRFALVTTAWRDDDADGLRGPAEPALAGVVAHLETGDAQPARHADGTRVDPRTTGGDGTVAFDDLPDGVYRVRYELPAGHRLTVAVAAAGTVAVDSDADAVDATGTVGLSGPVPLDADAEGLTLPQPSDGLAADRVAHASVGATVASEVLAG
ncbi:SdrD B-like domain-containing protein [Cellulomonas biazotea]|uniref:SdrD B-like domain-containing protein n=3 Tax=Cellulomonas biazotea TaxID=1709 RepID=UPI0035EB37A1